MTTLSEKIAELHALGRPPMVWAGLKAISAWRDELDAWRAANPGGEERYCELLAEIEVIEKSKPPPLDLMWAERAGLGERMLEAVSAPLQTSAVLTVRKWQSSGKSWCVLLGNTGTGKSVAASLAIRDAVVAGRSGVMMRASDFARVAGGFDGMADKLLSVWVLVIDDFGTEHLSDFARSVLFSVMSARHDMRKPTIITSNLSGQEFRERLGSRLADRIRNDCIVVDMRGESLRGKAGGA